MTRYHRHRSALILLALLTFLFHTQTATAQQDNGDDQFAWQSLDPILPPDFESYFPVDPEAGRRLDEMTRNRFKNVGADEQLFKAVRQGFRTTSYQRSTILSMVGGRYIWRAKKQHPMALEIMYHAIGNPNLSERHQAIYYGLSVAKPKSAAILKTLADVAMTTDDPNDTGRIAWGAKDQQTELISFLSPYLESNDDTVRKHGEVMRDIFSGEMEARDYWEENRAREARIEFGDRMDGFRFSLEEGDSETRHEILKLIRSNHLDLIADDRGRWLDAYIAAAEDPNAEVRRLVAELVGYGWFWSSEEYDLRAIELLLRMALDEDDEVRKGASYFGLSRLPENHPARPRINETKKFHMAQRLDRIRQHAFKLIENGEFKKVEGLLHEIDPNDGRYFNSESDRDVVRVVYDAIAKKLADVRKSNESPEVN